MPTEHTQTRAGPKMAHKNREHIFPGFGAGEDFDILKKIAQFYL